MSGASEAAATRHMRRKWRPSLRAILAALNLTVLLLPFAGLLFFRLYDAHLVRETETELIGQAATLGAVFRDRMRTSGSAVETLGAAAANDPSPKVDDYYRPVAPVTDLGRDEVQPPRPDPRPAGRPADAHAARIGADMTRLIVEAQRETLIGIRLLDHQGIIVASTMQPRHLRTRGLATDAATPDSGGGTDVGLSFAHVGEVAEALSGRYVGVLRARMSEKPQPAISSISRGARVRVFAAYPIVDSGRLLGVAYLSRTPDNIMHKLYFARDRLAMAALSTLALVLLLTALTDRLISGPIAALNARARQLAAGDPKAPTTLDHAGTRELAQLSDSFSDMAAALQSRATHVRDFAAHVSHELKTPLTSIKGAVELIGEHGASMAEVERARFLANISEDAERLSRLVDRLHELARAEHAVAVLETIDLGEALAEIRDAHASVSLRIDLEAPAGLAARISREALGIVAANIVANAVHGGAHRLSIRLARDGSLASITFADDGGGIPPDIAARIFEPFFTTRQASGGTGLGLRIVRSIVESARGTVALVPSSGGAVFRVTLPLAG